MKKLETFLGCFVMVAATLAAAEHDRKSSKANPDHDFVMKAASGGMMEVELGKIAVEKAASADVKQFAQRMVDDHSAAGEKLKSVASGNGMTLPAEMKPEHRAAVTKFANLQGAAFDRAYVRHMLQDHKKDVAEFEKVSKSAKIEAIKNFATETLPTLRQHLQMVMDLNAKMASTPSNTDSASREASKTKQKQP